MFSSSDTLFWKMKSKVAPPNCKLFVKSTPKDFWMSDVSLQKIVIICDKEMNLLWSYGMHVCHANVWCSLNTSTPKFITFGEQLSCITNYVVLFYICPYQVMHSLEKWSLIANVLFAKPTLTDFCLNIPHSTLNFLVCSYGVWKRLSKRIWNHFDFRYSYLSSVFFRGEFTQIREKQTPNKLLPVACKVFRIT